MFGALTVLLPRLKAVNTAMDPEQYSALERDLDIAVYRFTEDHKEMGLNKYRSILEDNGISLLNDSWEKADLEKLDGQAVMALIVGAFQTERFCEGTLAGLFADGYMTSWVQRLYDIDQQTINSQWCRCE